MSLFNLFPPLKLALQVALSMRIPVTVNREHHTKGEETMMLRHRNMK